MRLSKRLEKAAKSQNDSDNYESVRSQRAELAKKATELAFAVTAMREKMTSIQMQALHDRRKASIGLEMDQFTGTTGRTYNQVRITSITNAGINITHSSGIARLVASDLNQEQLFRFGIDPETSKKVVSLENEKATAYHELVKSHQRTLKAKAEREESLANLSRQELRPSISSSALPPSVSPLDQPARPLGNGRSIWRSRGSSYRYYYSNPSSYTRAGSRTYFPSRGSNGRIVAPTAPRPTPSPPCPTD